MHGGASPRKHGFRASGVDEAKVAAIREQIRTNAADVIDDKAARLLALVDKLYERMHPDGTVVTERVATKEEIVDRVRDANGELGEAQHVREIRRSTRKKVDVTQPLAEATAKLVKMLSEAAAMRRQPPPIQQTTFIIGQDAAAQILLDEFSDSGALPEPTGDVADEAHDGG